MAPVIGITATLKEDGDLVAERPLGRFVRADFDYVEGVAEAGGAHGCGGLVAGPLRERGRIEAVL